MINFKLITKKIKLYITIKQVNLDIAQHLLMIFVIYEFISKGPINPKVIIELIVQYMFNWEHIYNEL